MSPYRIAAVRAARRRRRMACLMCEASLLAFVTTVAVGWATIVAPVPRGFNIFGLALYIIYVLGAWYLHRVLWTGCPHLRSRSSLSGSRPDA